MVLAAWLGAAPAVPAHADTATYRDTAEEIRNPERGLFAQQEDLPGPLDDVRPRGLTVVRTYFRLDPYRDTPTLPDAYLVAVERTFADARDQGVKLVVRFAYTQEAGPDAPLDVVLAHIDQLGPVLRAGRDVILVIESGFIGRWGEWHSSTRGTDTRAAKERILRRQLAAFPAEVKLALRYPRDKRAILGTTPVAPEEAHSGAPRARVGHHNDCFVAGDTEGGTWQDWRGATGERERRFVEADAAHVPMGGETCVLGGLEPRVANCDNARAELARRSFTVLNADFYPGILDLWRAEGCFDEIARRLGPRFALVDAQVPDAVAAGGSLDLTFRVRNDGYAAPYNPRPVEVVLRHRATGAQATLPTQADPRLWRPGRTETVSVGVPLGMDLPRGTHDVALRLPDPSERLRDRPEYAVRLANPGVWDAGRGVNELGLAVQVTASAPVAAADAVVGSVEELLERVGGGGPPKATTRGRRPSWPRE